MHSQHILRLRRQIFLLILGACIGVSAQAGQQASGKKVSQPAAAFPLQTGYALAGAQDDEECFDDYGAQWMQTASASATESTQHTRAERRLPAAARESQAATASVTATATAPQKDKPALPAALPQSAVTMPVSVAPVATAPSPVWEIVLTDRTLNGAIARWTMLAGWQLRWEMPVDYAVEAHTSIPGTFEDAVESVARSMETAEVPMKAIFYKGNKVLRIVPRGAK